MNVPPPPAKPRRPLLRRLTFLGLLLGLLVVVIFGAMTWAQAWGMTHYQPAEARSTRIRELTSAGKARFLFTGPTVRRMSNVNTPDQRGLEFSTKVFRNARGQRIEAWEIPAPGDGPLVLMFPGYAGSKDTLLAAAVEFHRLGCTTWLMDFAGIGGSDGTTTTIGWREAGDVTAAVHAASAAQPGRRVILYGTSMGAAAVLRAVHLGEVHPAALVLECPFDRLTTTIGNRCGLLGLPRKPFAAGVVFWASVQQRYNAFAHNPVDYARDVRCPTLLMQGEEDYSVGLGAAHRIAAALGKNGTLKVFPKVGHAYLAVQAADPWRAQVGRFLQKFQVSHTPAKSPGGLGAT
ncbi:MAG: alpha/beta fold hydrolase [Chthoniobacter sp.]|nr:alpha/beta fold hydrolase [Chthoniobacter sp.]